MTVERFAAVLAAARAGEEWALAVLYRRLNPALLGYLRSVRPEDADDLASETWISVARGLPRFRGDEADLRRWVFTIARRRLLDLRRRERRRPRTVGDLELGALPATAPDVEEQALAAFAAREALDELAKLPPDDAEIILLRVVAGLSAEDVAAITGRTAGSVRVLQHRALKRLLAVLGKTLVTLPRAAAM